MSGPNGWLECRGCGASVHESQVYHGQSPEGWTAWHYLPGDLATAGELRRCGPVAAEHERRYP